MASNVKFSKAVEYVAGNIVIRFQPIDGPGIPGFTHKVLIFCLDDGVHRNLIARDWLGSDFKVSEKVAAFYYEKHVEKKAA